MRRSVQGIFELLETRRLLSTEGFEPIDFGDAPNSYGTTLAVNGARHDITPTLHLGLAFDAEPDGQPSPGADKDDSTGVPDDEDGVVLLTPLTPGAMATVQVTNGAGQGVLNAWLDFGIDGAFVAGDQIITNVVLPAASVTNINFMVPAAAISGTTYARFRLAGTFGCPPIGAFGPGEVEDYRGFIGESDNPMDFGDAPDFTGAPFRYPTTFGGIVGDPARHILAANGPRLGPTIDPEPDGQPTLTALGDDTNALFPGVPDDEDGITASGGVPIELVSLTLGGVINVEVNNTAAPGLLNAWFDWNQDGDWNDAGEQVAANVAAPAGVTILPVPIPFGMTPGSFVYSRYRLSTVAGLTPKGAAADGEVEDYRQIVEGTTEPNLDFGDAPDSAAAAFQYPTMLAGISGNPARHLIVAGAPRLGPTIDAEPDGQQSLLANGDDVGGIDDENGITIGGANFETVPLQSGATMTVQVTNTGAAGRFNAWFDWNQDGDWSDPGEHVAVNQAAPPGVTNFSFFVPSGLTANANIYSRWRLNSTGGLAPGGAAADGEVEDYRNRALPDTTKPKVISASLEYETRQAVTLNFDEPVNPATVGVADLGALNLDDGTTPAATAVIMGSGNLSATWVYNVPLTYVNDGDYDFTIAAGAVSDPAGNGLAAAFSLNGPTIYYLGGDADRDRDVDSDDFNILATNFGLAGKTFSQGNFNYDALGMVDSDDFNILAGNFGTMVAPMIGGSGGGQSIFGTKEAALGALDELLA